MSSINLVDAAGSALNSVLPIPLVGSGQADMSKDQDPHALSILSKVLHDVRFKPLPTGGTAPSGNTSFNDVLQTHGEAIAKYVRGWNVDKKTMEETGLWEKKVEEVVWCVVVLYGVAGWVDGKDNQDGFTSDFFL